METRPRHPDPIDVTLELGKWAVTLWAIVVGTFVLAEVVRLGALAVVVPEDFPRAVALVGPLASAWAMALGAAAALVVVVRMRGAKRNAKPSRSRLDREGH